MLTLCHNYYGVTNNNKHKNDGQNYSKRKFVFGVFILFLVSVLWVVSSELTKYIYTEKKLERPFLVTYVRSSLLFIYLLVLCFTPPSKDPCQPADYTQLVEPGDSTFVPVRAGETTDSDDAAPRAVRFNKVAEARPCWRDCRGRPPCGPRRSRRGEQPPPRPAGTSGSHSCSLGLYQTICTG
ncbi:unnamed protein product [Leptidea sinapis]|uniref:Uncharacterized protein n=1 Tax=Leptidea sinapis TaxID=189913 RepID=A0A5E4R277_9NEOP|nr:unnamed protein product [Leptidea sinapis]